MPIIQTKKELRPREFNDVYPTPISHVKAGLSLIPWELEPLRVLDPGAGDGVWGRYARELWPTSYILGAELRETMTIGEQEYPLISSAYNEWHYGDFLNASVAEFGGQVNVVLGNPPYKFAEKFLRKSFEFLEEGGYMVQLLRLAFLEGQRRGRGFWREFPPIHVSVCCDRPSFTGYWTIGDNNEPEFVADGKTDATAYAYFVWQKGFTGTPGLSMLHSDDINWEKKIQRTLEFL